MKLKLTVSSAFVAIAMTSGAYAADCESIGDKVRKAIKDKPDAVLVVVDKMISKNESCACEIVKAAIEESNASEEDVKQIVMTAVNAAQGMVGTIAECALAAAPEAAAEIKAGLNEVMEGVEEGAKNPEYGEKNVVIDESEDFGPAPVVVSGVYLIAPVAPSADITSPADEAIERLAKRLGLDVDTVLDLIEDGSLVDILRRRFRPRDDDDDVTTVPPMTP